VVSIPFPLDKKALGLASLEFHGIFGRKNTYSMLPVNSPGNSAEIAQKSWARSYM